MAAVWFPPDYSCVGEGEPALRLAVGGWDGGSVVQGYGDQCTRFKGMIRECHVSEYASACCGVQYIHVCVQHTPLGRKKVS